MNTKKHFQVQQNFILYIRCFLKVNGDGVRELVKEYNFFLQRCQHFFVSLYPIQCCTRLLTEWNEVSEAMCHFSFAT